MNFTDSMSSWVVTHACSCLAHVRGKTADADARPAEGGVSIMMQPQPATELAMEAAAAAQKKFVVIGRGVSGLTCAIVLLREKPGCVVEIWSSSDVATTVPPTWVWEYPPYKVEPEEASKRWSRESLDEFEKLSHDPETNVVMLQIANMFHDVQEPEPDHAAVLGKFAPYLTGAAALAKAHSLVWPAEASCPPQFKDAVSYQAPAVAAPEYLAWLEAQIQSLGGTFKTIATKFESIDEIVCTAGSETRTIINCAGLGGLELAHDEEVAGKDGCLYPCKGQLVHVDAPWLRTAVFADDEDWYAIPWCNSSKVQLGGTSEEHVMTKEPDPEAQRGILERNTAGIPSLKAAPVVGSFAGLRPMRKSGVRIEREHVVLATGESVTVIHNYGHGGAGMICSWGCAKDVVGLCTDDDHAL